MTKNICENEWRSMERRRADALPHELGAAFARRATDQAPEESLLLQPGCEVEGVNINLPTIRDARVEVIKRARLERGFSLFTLNLDHLAKIRNNSRFRRAYKRADLVSADGWPVVWLANRRGRRLWRTCGSDLVEPVCVSAAKNGTPLFFIGPESESQAAAIAVLKTRYPTLKVAGTNAARISNEVADDEVRAIAAAVKASGARLCFICLGAPKQELLADALAPMCRDVGFMCVGAGLDFISGRARRAPRWFQRAGLEWLWRLLGNPTQLAGRYARGAHAFSLIVLKSIFAPK